MGGEALVMEKDWEGWNSLHYACEYNASIDVISLMVGMIGEELVIETDCNGSNPLHCACGDTAARAYKGNEEEDTLLNEEVLSLLTQNGGAEILTQTNKLLGKTTLQFFVANNDEQKKSWDQARKERFFKRLSDNALILINNGIELKVGGEYSIGGLFTSTSSQEIQDQIYENWDSIVLPALEQVMALPHSLNLPILQALIINKAPQHLIKSDINRFLVSINIIDSFSKYPIDVAARHDLAWDGGMKEVVERSDVSLLVEREDLSPVMYLFMVAAVEESYGYDFGSVFHLIKASPKLVVVQS